MDTGTYEIKHLLQESQQRSISEKPVVPMVEDTGIQNDNQMATKWQPNDNQMTTQYRIGKDRIGKDRLDEDRLDTPRLIIASHCQTHGLFITSSFNWFKRILTSRLRIVSPVVFNSSMNAVNRSTDR